MSGRRSVEHLKDMHEEVLEQLRARSAIYRVSRRINYTDQDAAIDELAVELLARARGNSA